MKYCSNCGSEMPDGAIVCANCGCATEGAEKKEKNSGVKTAAKIFMVLSCISSAFFLIPLCWTIPMTVSYFKKVKNNQPVGTGFKVCSFLFVNMIAGILMLCDGENN